MLESFGNSICDVTEDVVPPLPRRSCVGIMLVNSFGQIWLGRRTPKWLADRSACIWQMPQGGIEPNEDPCDAALRELAEETAACSVEIIGKAAQPISFDLPPHLIGVALKRRYRGQSLQWYAMRFVGHDSEIDIRARNGRKSEFNAWRWAHPDAALDHVPEFKREMYRRVLAEFAPLLRRHVAA